MSLTRWTPRLLLLATLAALAAIPVLLGPDGSAVRPAFLLLVLGLGWVVSTYAATNLRGQRHRERFAALLLLAVGGLALMVAATPLWLAAVGWSASGLALTGLVAHRDDEAAHRAATLVRRRLLVADAALWAAVVVELLGGPTAATGTLLALAAAVRSALVPAHRWLPETAEAPSPVSALLHAGIVNGGLMLLVLHWSLVTGTPAHAVLLVTGAASVVVGLASQRLRADVKGRLASSTSTQMGLVAVQLGLGFPVAAMTHLIGHGCWKAWLFLRAGGTPGRTGTLAAPPAAHAPARVVAALAGAAVLATGLLLVTPFSAGEAAGEVAFAAGMVGLLAAAAGLEAVRLERTTAPRRLVVGTGVVLALVAYVAAVTALTGTAHAWFPGTDPVSVPVALVAVALLGVAGLAATRWSTATDTAAADAVAATLLPPGARVSGRVVPVATHHDVSLGGLPLAHAGTVADLAASAVGPAWPLHSLVASNPVATLEKLGVEDAAALVRRLHGRDPRPRLTTFLDLHARGIVGTTALRRALAESDPTGPLAGVTVDDLVAFTRSVADADLDLPPLRVRACDRAPSRRGRSVADVLDLHAAAWTARAWGGEPQTDPWSLWLASARRTGHDLAWGVRGATALARALPDDPATALAVLWRRVQPLTGGQDFFTYAACQLSAGRGWAAHARWRAREAGDQQAVLQLLALRTVLDLVLAEAAGTQPGDAQPAPAESESEHAASAAGLIAVWQRALDLAARDGLVRRLGATPTVPQPRAGDDAVRVQSTWCIDARSEPVRRALEALGGHDTFGYAGFFGAAVSHCDAEGHVTARCPGLASPALATREEPGALGTLEALHRVVTRAGRQPSATFAHAEVSGVPALASTITATLRPAALRRLGNRVAGRPAYDRMGPLPTAVAADVAEAFLRTTGIGAAPAPVLLLVGHGSSTENNAFASAYDCGACGGHAGDVSATLVARALNDGEVRAELERRGLPLPEGTLAVAALHDTTVDEVRLLRTGTESPERRALLDAVQADLDRAGLAAATARLPQLPGVGRTDGHAVEDARSVRRTLAARAADWSEPMPEWGLAGNLALVVGPRSLTRDLDLGGTAFLHSYDADLDPDGSVLSAVLNGPVMVTQWIHAQYDATVCAPDLYGAGDKTTHNVVGDVGVLTGAHGDLRTGLPWQAVSGHDPADPRPGTTSLRHLPARHLVVIAADPAAVHRVVEQHEALHQVVGNGWLQLVALDPATGALLEMDRSLTWNPCQPLGPSRRAARTAAAGASAPRTGSADAPQDDRDRRVSDS